MPVPAATTDARIRGLLTGVGLLRLGALAWAVVVVAIDLGGTTALDGALAVSTLCVAAAWTGLLLWGARRGAGFVAHPLTVAADLAFAALVTAMDHLAYDGAHPQSFGSAWPLGAVVTAGVLRGPALGGMAGLGVGIAGLVGTAAFAEGGLDGRWTASIGTVVLLALAGVLAGAVTDALRRAEAATARALAREEVARRLHDGVLQTLAAVQRRSDDPDLVRLAREQELELRAEIGDPRASAVAGAPPDPALLPRLRAVLATAARRSSARCELVVVEEPEQLADEVVDAVCGAVAEAITNAGKHGHASRVVVCVDAGERGGLSCTVSDDGEGFDPATVVEGVGLALSVRARVEEVGGTVEVSSAPGRGCEVRLDLPGVGRARHLR